MTTLDHKAAGERLGELQAHMMATSPGRDWRKHSAGELVPPSLPIPS